MTLVRLGRAVLTASVAAFGCGTTQPSGIDLDIEITAVEEQPEPMGGATVAFTVTNVGETSVWLERCGDRLMTFVDVRVGGGWEYYRGDICPAVHVMSPWELPPGATRTGSRGIQEAGYYRLRFGTAADPAHTTNWIVASPPFVVS